MQGWGADPQPDGTANERYPNVRRIQEESDPDSGTPGPPFSASIRSSSKHSACSAVSFLLFPERLFQIDISANPGYSFRCRPFLIP